MNNKLIDIIIPIYNAQQTLARALSSVVLQTVCDKIQLSLVIDGEPYTKYSNIIEAFKKIIDIQIFVLLENVGPGRARQYAIDNTQCPYIAFLDADDTYFSSFSIEFLLNKMETNNSCAFVVGKHLLEERKFGLDFLTYKTNWVWVFAKLYRRSIIDKYNIHFNYYKTDEDVAFNHCFLYVINKIEQPVECDETVYLWHHNADSLTRHNFNQKSDLLITNYINSMIWAIEWGLNQKNNNEGKIIIDIVGVFANAYGLYQIGLNKQLIKTDSSLKTCARFYHEYYKIAIKQISSDVIEGITINKLTEEVSLGTFLPKQSYYDFIKTLEEIKYE